MIPKKNIFYLISIGLLLSTIILLSSYVGEYYIKCPNKCPIVQLVKTAKCDPEFGCTPDGKQIDIRAIGDQ